MSGRLGGPSSIAGTRGRIIDLVRRAPISVTDIAERLGLTYNAVRTHLAGLERDGLIRRAGQRRGVTRPSAVYELVPGVEDTLSRAYTPFASHLVRTLGDRLPEPDLIEVMREVGRRLARDVPRASGSLAQRVEAASALLQELGAPNEIEPAPEVMRIRGFGCVLAAAVHGQPHVCHAMESLLEEVIDAPVRSCCDRTAQPRCCFEVAIKAGDQA